MQRSFSPGCTGLLHPSIRVRVLKVRKTRGVLREDLYAVSLVASFRQPATNVLRIMDTADVDDVTKETHVVHTVCLSVLHSQYSNFRQLIETIELNRLFGAERFVIYYLSASRDVQLVLDTYSRDGIVTVIPWNSLPVPVSNGTVHTANSSAWQVHYFGQVVALNDCLYRSMRHTTYVLVSDVDEIVVPRGYGATSNLNWNTMLDSATLDWLSHRGNSKLIPGAYLIRNVFFNANQSLQENNGASLMSWLTSEVESTIVADSTKRDSHIHPYRERTKYFVLARTAVMLGIHSPLKSINSTVKTLRVGAGVALLHHYKAISARRYTDDLRMKRFSGSLIQRLVARRRTISEVYSSRHT